MESLVREANTREELQEVDFHRLQEYYESNAQRRLDKRNATALLRFLLSKTGEKVDNPVNPELRPKAKAALGVLSFFVSTGDEAFCNAFEKQRVGAIANKLKLTRHLREGPEDHRRTVYRFIHVISTRFPKFANWRLLVKASEHDRVLRGLAELLMAEGGAATAAVLPSAEARLPPPGQYYEQPVPEVLELFRTRPGEGLSDDEAASRRTRYGANALPRPPPPSVLKTLLYQLTDFMVIILIVVTVIELALQEWVPAGVLALVVFFNVLVGFVQELKAQRALRALESLHVTLAQVVRNGEQVQIPAEQLVPGDLVNLDEGCQIPADLRLIEAVNLNVIEALLTGESVPVEKTNKPLTQRNPALGDIKCMAFMSTTVVRGRGVGVVCATGKSTEVGKISKALSKKEETQTLLQKRLRGLGKVLVVLAVVLCAIVVGITLLRLGLAGKLYGDHIFEAVETGVSLGVSAIPEGLIAVVTITMALGVQRMAAKNAVVKRLAVVESLGSITVICSDKTGTLTEGIMKAEEMHVAGKRIQFTGSGIAPVGDVLDELSQKIDPADFTDGMQRAFMCCALCNNSSVSYDEAKRVWMPVGDPTEVAILMAAEKAKANKVHWIEQGWSFETEVPFDSDRKCMSVLYNFLRGSPMPASGVEVVEPAQQRRHKGRKSRRKKGKRPAAASSSVDGIKDDPLSKPTIARAMLLAKGAPEAIIRKCTRFLTPDGLRSPLGPDEVANIEKDAMEMAGRGLRVLALAYRAMAAGEFEHSGENLEHFEAELVFLGLIGLIDPPRLEVREAVESCRAAGIKVCMITGDHPLTALAIAQQLGIADKDDEKALMRGADIDAISKNDLDLLAQMEPFPSVFARVNPQHKLKIVQALKMRGEIAAMTGDGVNDAPAIKQSHVGVAMGKTGTDLTKDAADIILLDDNFATIVAAIKEGRHINDNIRKFILYLLSSNSAQIYTVLLCGIIGLPAPFTAIMILWVNLVVGVLPALSLGADPPEVDIMARLPRNPHQHIFTLKSIGLLLYQGFTMSALSVLLYGLCLLYEEPDALKLGYGGVDNFSSETSSNEINSALQGLERAQTLALVTLTFIQLIHAYLSRSVKNSVFNRHIFNNMWLNGAVLLSAVLIIFGSYVPGVNAVLEQVPLKAIDWLKILGACVVHLACVEGFKVVLRKKCSKPKENSLFYADV